MTTQKEILSIIGRKQPDFDVKHAKKWMKKNPLFVKELDAEIVANQYINEATEKERITQLDTLKGILLGTTDIKWADGRIKRVSADILTETGDIERVQWWGSIPRDNRTMEALPILHECEFKGEINRWVSPYNQETYENFNVEAIIPSEKLVATGDLSFSELSMINIDSEMEDIPEGKYMAVVFGKISIISFYREKTWDNDLDEFVFSSEHPLLMRDNLCLTMGVRVNEDIYVKAHFPEQHLGFPTWIINDNSQKINSIKQVLSKMPVNAETDKDIFKQLQKQAITVNSIFKEFIVMVVGEIRVTRTESVDETRTFIDMNPTFISIRSTIPEDEEKTQSTLDIADPKELADAEEIEKSQTLKPLDKDSEVVITAILEHFDDDETNYTEVRRRIDKKKDDLGMFVNDFVATCILAKDLGVSHEFEKKKEEKDEKVITEEVVDQVVEKFETEAETEVSIMPPPTGFTKEKLIFEAVNQLGPNGEILALAKFDEIIQQIERLGLKPDLSKVVKLAAEELKIDITGYEKNQVKSQQEIAKKQDGKKSKPTPQSKKKKPGKKDSKASKWNDHYQYINEILSSEDGKITNLNILPMPVWDILLKVGYCFEPEAGVIHVHASLQLDTKTKKVLHKFFNKNPDIKLRPDPIEDVEKTIREKLIELKKAVPNSTAEHLKPMLASFNIDAPIELIEKIWNTL